MANYTSKFIQLTDFILMEFRYTDPVLPENLSYTLTKVINGHTGENQILNQDSATTVTNNVRERSAIKISPAKHADLDKDQVPDWLSYDTQLAVSTVTAANVPYDTVIFHLLAGYNFEGLDGVILDVKASERSGKKLTMMEVVFLKDGDWFEYNPKPIFLGDRLYDKYLVVKIPSVKLNNDIYYSLEGNPSQVNTLIAKITSNGMGLLRGAPIEITATNIVSTTAQKVGAARYNIYNTGPSKTVAINQADEYASLSAVIQESNGGDYYEYFASWDGGFIEDFIFNANALPGNNWVVIHEIQVIEQIGSNFKTTARVQSIQEDAFDRPNLFRPVILNAATAFSFTIEYTVRMYNKFDSMQIIRVASVTSYNPKMWGRYIQKIQLLNEPEPLKVYNKIVSGPVMQNEAFLNTVTEVVPVNTKVAPAFFDRSIMTVSKETVFLDQNGQLRADKTAASSTVYGQGEAGIILAPFDNFFKFTILRTEKSTGGVPVPLDLGMNAEYFLVFINDNGEKLRFPHLPESVIGDPTKGDLVYKVQGSDAETILKSSNRQFWITSRFPDGSETTIYQGKFYHVDERAQYQANEDKIAKKSSTNAKSEEVIRTLEAKNKALEAALHQIKAGSVKTTTGTVDVKNELKPVIEGGIKLPSNLNPVTANEIQAQIPGVKPAVVTLQTSIVAQVAPVAPVKTKVEVKSKGNSESK
jgi:hypothetical protein